jgi:hypothetical protein
MSVFPPLVNHGNPELRQAGRCPIRDGSSSQTLPRHRSPARGLWRRMVHRGPDRLRKGWELRSFRSPVRPIGRPASEILGHGTVTALAAFLSRPQVGHKSAAYQRKNPLSLRQSGFRRIALAAFVTRPQAEIKSAQVNYPSAGDPSSTRPAKERGRRDLFLIPPSSFSIHPQAIRAGFVAARHESPPAKPRPATRIRRPRSWARDHRSG